jgi:hypothetical protein
MLLSMMQMPGLGSPAAADMSLMLSSAAAAAEGYGEPGPGPSSSGTGDSHADAVQADDAAAQFLGSQAALSLASQEAALSQLKKACKAAKGGHFGAKAAFQTGTHGAASQTEQHHQRPLTQHLEGWNSVLMCCSGPQQPPCLLTAAGAPRKRPGHKKQQLVCKVRSCTGQKQRPCRSYQTAGVGSLCSVSPAAMQRQLLLPPVWHCARISAQQAAFCVIQFRPQMLQHNQQLHAAPRMTPHVPTNQQQQPRASSSSADRSLPAPFPLAPLNCCCRCVLTAP